MPLVQTVYLPKESTRSEKLSQELTIESEPKKIIRRRSSKKFQLKETQVQAEEAIVQPSAVTKAHTAPQPKDPSKPEKSKQELTIESEQKKTMQRRNSKKFHLKETQVQDELAALQPSVLPQALSVPQPKEPIRSEKSNLDLTVVSESQKTMQRKNSKKFQLKETQVQNNEATLKPFVMPQAEEHSQPKEPIGFEHSTELESKKTLQRRSSKKFQLKEPKIQHEVCNSSRLNTEPKELRKSNIPVKIESKAVSVTQQPKKQQQQQQDKDTEQQQQDQQHDLKSSSFTPTVSKISASEGLKTSQVFHSSIAKSVTSSAKLMTSFAKSEFSNKTEILKSFESGNGSKKKLEYRHIPIQREDETTKISVHSVHQDTIKSQVNKNTQYTQIPYRDIPSENTTFILHTKSSLRTAVY